jgi:hypothetical protein
MARMLFKRLALFAVAVLVIQQVLVGLGSSPRDWDTTSKGLSQPASTLSLGRTPISTTTYSDASFQALNTNASFDQINHVSAGGTHPRFQPKIRLHVGPHKTGTTTLQRYTSDHREDLLRDGIWIPKLKGVPKPNFAFAHCFVGGYRAAGGDYGAKYCNTKLFPRLQEQLLAFSSENTTTTSTSLPDILIIAEDFDRPTIRIPRIRQQFKSYTDSFEITLTYRRLHDWLPSWYNEIMSLYIQKFTGSSRNEPMLSFVMWVEKCFDSFLKRHTKGLLEQYSHDFPNIKVMNFHSTDADILSHYICTVLKANYTCDRLLQHYRQSNITKIRVVRASQPMELQRLVIAAYKKGFLSVPKLSVSIVRQLSYTWHAFLKDSQITTEEFGTLMTCVNQTLWQRVWDEQIIIESSLFPESLSTLSESYAKARWSKWCVYNEDVLFANRSLLEATKFCDLEHANCSRIKPSEGE